MRHSHDDKGLENAIRRAVGTDDVRFDADAWREKYHGELASLESRGKHAAAAVKRHRWTWRSIMSNRIIQIAASAAVIAIIAVAAVILTNGGGSSIALAAVLQELQSRCYEFKMSVRTNDNDSTVVKGMVLEPGRMRLQQQGGTGPVTCIINNDTGQSLVLFERWQAAYRFDRQEAEAVGMVAFLLQPSNSIQDLWNLEAEATDETPLGRRTIDGILAEGFQVVQEHDAFAQTIGVWVDAQTGEPLEVNISWQPTDSEQPFWEMTLGYFQIVAEPDAALFSTNVPNNYTLANRQTLEELVAESDDSASSNSEAAPSQAQVILDALAAWSDGKQQQALDLLMAVDWSRDIHFDRAHYLFTMTERQYVSLVTEDRQQIMDEIMAESAHCRTIARKLVDLGQDALAAQDLAQAERLFSASVHLGRLLNRDENMMLIVRLIGIAIQRLTLPELLAIYEKRGETEKLQAAQVQLDQLEQQVEQIKKRASGG